MKLHWFSFKKKMVKEEINPVEQQQEEEILMDEEILSKLF